MMISYTLITLGMLVFADSAPDTSSAEWRLVDIAGRVHEPFADDRTPAFAIVFVSVDCPIANSYQPLLQKLARQHDRNHIPVYLVHPHRDLTVERARQHVRNFQIETPVVVDDDLSITQRVKARVMPEAFVFARGVPQPVYRGRIDNRYAGYGRKRRQATTSELADALEAVAAGRRPKTRQTKAIGCLIPR